ncbi:MAG: response regulator [Synechocystis sp.]|jgi:CheY-like chemotaxis protein
MYCFCSVPFPRLDFAMLLCQTTVLLIGDLIGDLPESPYGVRQSSQRHGNNSGEKQYITYEAATLAEGMDLWNSKSPTLVLVDVNLPDGNGLDFVERLLEENPNPVDKLPVIVVGQQADAKAAVRALKLGAMDYLIKDDLTTVTLIATVNQALSTLRLKSEFEGFQRQNIQLQGVRDRLWQSLDVQASLDLVAETARQFLTVDRVLIYQFDQEAANAKLVAELVVDPALSCWQTPIAQMQDSFLGKNYSEESSGLSSLSL